jgi:hypothetical protein
VANKKRSGQEHLLLFMRFLRFLPELERLVTQMIQTLFSLAREPPSSQWTKCDLLEILDLFAILGAWAATLSSTGYYGNHHAALFFDGSTLRQLGAI